MGASPASKLFVCNQPINPYLECKTGGFSDEVLFGFQLTLIF